MSHRTLLAANLVLALCSSHVNAQEVRLFGPTEAVDPTDVARILEQSQQAAPAIKFRSLKLLDQASVKPSRQADASSGDDEVAPTQVAYQTRADTKTGPRTSSGTVTAENAPASTRATPSAVALPVQFEFDSAQILPSARRQLDALAEGIRMLPPTRSVVIEGHTDATGSEQYNEQLSQRRAYSVKNYLVAMHHIDPARLHAVGMGQFGLLTGFDPNAAENRRVQFRGE